MLHDLLSVGLGIAMFLVLLVLLEGIDRV